MTPEEFEYEVLLHEKYQQILKRGPIDPELQKRIEEWAKGEDDALPIPQQPDDEWEDVEPSEVIPNAGRDQSGD